MRKFTPEEDKVIRDNYLKMPIAMLEKNMGRPKGSVRQRLVILGLKVPAHLVKKFVNGSRLKRGNESPTKGKKMEDYLSPEKVARVRGAQFKTGNLPYNTLHDGCLSIRKDSRGVYYEHIRIGLGKWIHHHRYLWEQANGPIPKGMVVSFIDGNQQNCELDNLELLSRKDMMLRNSAVIWMPKSYVARLIAGKKDKDLIPEILKNKDLIDLKRTSMKLNRAINEQSKS